ncbi:MAG TPA: hypothetical protein VMU96_09020 [Casimicrobiaceae bacterium]|nr:hypothetical protein [Casimicrobiaceae bacterium]
MIALSVAVGFFVVSATVWWLIPTEESPPAPAPTPTQAVKDAIQLPHVLVERDTLNKN